MNDFIKVLHIVPDLAYGGVEKIVLNYYERLDHSSFHFDFVTHGKVEAYHQDIIDQGSRIYYLKTIGKLGYSGYKKQVQKYIDISEYDIIHVHIGHIVGLYACVFNSLGAKKIICHAHTTKCLNNKHLLFMPIFRFMANHYSNESLACGVEAGKFCFGKHKSFKVLQNSIDVSLYESVNENDIKKLKDEFNINESDFIIGHVGHFSKPKNHIFIVKLIEQYCQVCPNVKFILVGDGPLQAQIIQKVNELSLQNNVIFTGIRNDIPYLMSLFDVFILPSLHEGLPVVSIEAQAAGKPCLISNCVDRTLDIGLGLVEFLSIDNGCEDWINKLQNFNKNSFVKPTNISEAFFKRGYDISASVESLRKIYLNLVKEK